MSAFFKRPYFLFTTPFLNIPVFLLCFYPYPKNEILQSKDNQLLKTLIALFAPETIDEQFILVVGENIPSIFFFYLD